MNLSLNKEDQKNIAEIVAGMYVPLNSTTRGQHPLENLTVKELERHSTIKDIVYSTLDVLEANGFKIIKND